MSKKLQPIGNHGCGIEDWCKKRRFIQRNMESSEYRCTNILSWVITEWGHKGNGRDKIINKNKNVSQTEG